MSHAEVMFMHEAGQRMIRAYSDMSVMGKMLQQKLLFLQQLLPLPLLLLLLDQLQFCISNSNSCR